MAPVTRIAMWSGPRNISTAMMRAFENREDAVVVDEPMYAFFLSATGLDHPVAEEVIASQPTDWREVAANLVGGVPEGASVFYQKHMAHHLLPEVGRDWMKGLTHAFLIREPRAMLASYQQKRENPTLEDLGFPQQVALYDWLRENTEQTPPIVDSRDVLLDPAGMLAALCQALGVPFSERMLSWPAGKRDSDGVWADHWYDAVVESTGFQPYREKEIALDDELERLAEAARPHYEYLLERRLRT
jgi:hypothetical protein